jgi:hypothetical protein
MKLSLYNKLVILLCMRVCVCLCVCVCGWVHVYVFINVCIPDYYWSVYVLYNSTSCRCELLTGIVTIQHTTNNGPW